MTTTATNPLSFNYSTLATAFRDFQPFDPAPADGWNDTDTDAIYFVGAGSEYRLRRPTYTLGDLRLSADARTSYAALIDQLRGSTQLTADQSAKLDALSANLDSECPGITVNATIDHIRNTQDDDHSAIEVQAIWSEVLQAWLPAELKVGFTWGTSSYAVPESAMTILKAPDHLQVLSLAADLIPVLGEALQCVKFASYAAEIWNFAVGRLVEYADDGGRVYFPMATVQALLRVLRAITPADTRSAANMPAPDLIQLARQWDASYETSTIQDGVRYRHFDAERDLGADYLNWEVVGDPDTVGQYYVSLPELAFLPGGLGTLYTFKVRVGDANSFGAGMLLLDNQGLARMCAAVTQYENGNTCSGPPAWGNGEYGDGLIRGYIGKYFSEDAMYALIPYYNSSASKTHEAHLSELIQDMLLDFSHDTRRVSASSVAHTGLPQLPRLDCGTASTYADNGAQPAITSHATFVYGLHAATFATDDLWAEVLDNDGRLTHAGSASFQPGQNPSIAMLPSGLNAFEVHGGDGNNRLYYTVLPVLADQLSTPTTGHDFDQGENPAIAVSSTGKALEFHESPSSLGRQLWWNYFTFDETNTSHPTVSHSANGTSFKDGYNPAVTFVDDDASFAVAYDRDGIYVLLGTTDGEHVHWSSPELPVCPGDTPAIAVLSGGVLVVVSHDGANYAHHLRYSIGIARGTWVQWVVTNVEIGEGQEPALARCGSRLILAWRSASDTTLQARTLSADFPPGFV